MLHAAIFQHRLFSEALSAVVRVPPVGYGVHPRLAHPENTEPPITKCSELQPPVSFFMRQMYKLCCAVSQPDSQIMDNEHEANEHNAQVRPGTLMLKCYQTDSVQLDMLGDRQ